MEVDAPMKAVREDDDDDEEEPEDEPPRMTNETAAEREEAERLHRTAVAAEARAAARAAAKERGVVLSKEEDEAQTQQEVKPTFKTKKQREADAVARLEEKRAAREAEVRAAAAERRSGRGARFSAPPAVERKKKGGAEASSRNMLDEIEALTAGKRGRDGSTTAVAAAAAAGSSTTTLSAADKELSVIRESYLGAPSKKKKTAKPSEKFSRIFQFDWDASDDTSSDLNPLYARRHAVQPLLGRGYVAGLDMREQRRAHTFASTLSEKRMAEDRLAEEEEEDLSKQEKTEREDARKVERQRILEEMEKEAAKVAEKAMGRQLLHWTEKPLEAMDDRDWRIMKEDFDIRIRGGRAPLPLRNWDEALLIEPLRRAIATMGFKDPSPVQRATLPVGLELRDIIGVAETGSGKTAAFALPMLQYISQLPKERIASLAEDGPLALVLAPTRELATQINAEIVKLAQFMDIKTCVVVGGSSIEDQGFKLRVGVELIVGTPGRINDCLDSQYMVLNQANYVVLDEADRMIDMGFEPQVNEILEVMGGLLKSEDEVEIAEQEAAVKRGEACFRITAMFSATMPPAVERLARRFLRHPAIVAIGDEDSGKNKRIEQRIAYMKDSEKKNQLVDLLKRKTKDDKWIVFCNEKKTCDMVIKLAQQVIRSGIIHGGKSQDQRDTTLTQFKEGVFSVLVATDVAGRGLDIPDVAMVINYDMPLKIENYCHRIGRTGRAGKSGIATTHATTTQRRLSFFTKKNEFLTDSDEAMMYELREYLVQTDAEIHPKLEHNKAAHAKPGERNDRGELLLSRATKGKTEFLKEKTFGKE